MVILILKYFFVALCCIFFFFFLSLSVFHLLGWSYPLWTLPLSLLSVSPRHPFILSSLSLKCHLAFLFLSSSFISTGLLAHCCDGSTNEIVVRVCMACGSACQIFHFSQRVSEHWGTITGAQYKPLYCLNTCSPLLFSTSSSPSLASFSSASYIILFSLCVFH